MRRHLPTALATALVLGGVLVVALGAARSSADAHDKARVCGAIDVAKVQADCFATGTGLHSPLAFGLYQAVPAWCLAGFVFAVTTHRRRRNEPTSSPEHPSA